MKIEDGAGTGRLVKVNGRQELDVFAIIESEFESANDQGLAYNINSGEIASASGDATLLYFKNDEDTAYIIDAIACGFRGFTSLTDMVVVSIYRNPTGGDLITDATAADMEQNANFGSSNQLSAGTLVYKGKNAGTITGGDLYAIVYAGNNSRVFATLNIEIPKGGSIAMKVVGAGATAGNSYCALIGHLKDPVRDV